MDVDHVDHASTSAADGADDQGGPKRRRSFIQDEGGMGREGSSRFDNGGGGSGHYGGARSGVAGSGGQQQAGNWPRPLLEQLPRRLTAEHLFERLRPEGMEGKNA
jgi:hypothetical protein